MVLVKLWELNTKRMDMNVRMKFAGERGQWGAVAGIGRGWGESGYCAYGQVQVIKDR